MGSYFAGEIGEISKFITYVPYNLTANIKQTGILTAFIFLPLLINQLTPFTKLRPKLWKLILFLNGFVAISWFACLFPYILTTNVFLFTTYLYNIYAPFILFSQLYLIYVAYKANTKNSQVLFIGYGGYIFALFIYAILPNLGLLQQNLLVYNTFVLGSLFEIFMFMLILGKETFNVYQQRSDLLEKQKEHQSEIICAIVESQEKERNKVGRELHDMIGANISVIKQQADKSDSKLIHIIDRTIESVRNLSHGLVTPLIKDDDFVDEINELCVLFSNIDMKVNTHFHNWNKIDNKVVVTHLYRITQELLQNAVKHSNASKISIQFLVDKEGELTLMYEDNGIGFDYDEAKNGDGLGLINIENRIHIIESKIYYDTAKNKKGTTVIINVPSSSMNQ
jgi:signal transduction histidine kinase